MSKFIDLTGKRFGFLTVIKLSDKKENKDSHLKWDCVCDCGNEKSIIGRSLITGATKSCGCYFKKCIIENNKKNNTTHNMCKTPLYQKWGKMKNRCSCPNNPSYKHYGGKGICVCERWQTFENFYDDMFDSYVEGLSIERIDNNLGYCKENCKWIPFCEQPRNTSQNIIIELNGIQYILADLSRKYNIPYSALRTRLLRGWTVEDAISIPLQIHNKKE